MEKLKPISFNKEYYDYNNLFSTKYDDLFRGIIKDRGIGYLTSHQVTKFHKTKNKISAVVKGTKDYNVSVEYLDNGEINVECECPYHKETDKYCKHVYALILNLKMVYEKEKIINTFNVNCSVINDTKEKLKALANKNYLDPIKYSIVANDYNYCERNLKEMNDKFNKDNIYQIVEMTKRSYYYLNDIRNSYNDLLDYIEEGKNNTKESKGTIIEWETGDGLIDTLDNFIADLPLPVLEEVRRQAIEKGENTEILDKTITRIKKEELEYKKKQEKTEKEREQERKRYRKGLFFMFLSEFFNGMPNTKSKDTDYLMDLEQDLVDNNEYEPYHFEEEEMEEDDYYYEDD